MTPTPDPIAAIEQAPASELRRAAVNLVDTLVLERETNGQSKEFMDWAVFMTVRAFQEQCASLARKASSAEARVSELEREKAELLDALKPFSNVAPVFAAAVKPAPRNDDHEVYAWETTAGYVSITVGDFRRARALSLTQENSDDCNG